MQYDNYNELWRLTASGEVPVEELRSPTFLIAALAAAHRGRAIRLESRGENKTVAYILPRQVGALLVCAGGQVFVADEAKVVPPSASQFGSFFRPNDMPYTVEVDTTRPDDVLYNLLHQGMPHVQRPLPGGAAPTDAEAVSQAIAEAVEFGLAADRQHAEQQAVYNADAERLLNW